MTAHDELTGQPRSRYSSGAIALHWLIAVLLLGNLAVGLFVLEPLMDSTDAADKQLGLRLIALHKSVGLTILLLVVVRLAWRLAHPVPPLPGHMTPLERTLARTSHIGFYLVMFLLPLTGWAMVSTGKTIFPWQYFGLFDVPALPLPAGWGHFFHESHGILGWITAAMLVLHVAAALKHHYWDRDDVLARMLPGVRARRA